MNAYDRLLIAVSDMVKDAYHLDRHAPSDYRGGGFTLYSMDDVGDRLDESIRSILREVRERLLKEAEYERSSGRSYQREQRALTWSAAAELLTEFSRDFEFTDSPDLHRAAQWWRENRTHTPTWPAAAITQWLAGSAATHGAGTHRGMSDLLSDYAQKYCRPQSNTWDDRQRRLANLGTNVREARQRVGISRKKMAKRLQVTKEEIRTLEEGSSQTFDGIRLDNRHPALRWIAYYLGILIWDVLVFRDGDVERDDT